MKAYNFACLTVGSHYHRMWENESVGVSRITKGKLGEIAMEELARMYGLETESNFLINGGIDSFDLKVSGWLLSVKTKAFRRPMPGLEVVYLHVPCDQYPKLFDRMIDYLIAVYLGVGRNAEWKKIVSVVAQIVGAISLDEYDAKKALHRAGTYPPGWNYSTPFPPPDSWAVAWSELSAVRPMMDMMALGEAGGYAEDLYAKGLF